MAFRIVVEKDVEDTLINITRYHQQHYYNTIIPKRIAKNLRKLIRDLKNYPYKYNEDPIHPKFRKVVFVNCAYKINYFIDEENQTI